jgi:hypothetical protein
VHYGQFQNLKAFARSAKIISTTPGELYHSISDFRQQLRLVESSTLFTADKIIPRLNQSVQMKQAFEENISDVNEACELFTSYADCLLGLLGSEKELEGHSADLSIRLSNALKCYHTAFNKPSPAAIGDFIAMVVNKIGSIHLKELQKKYLKEFVNSGSVIINDVCDYFIVNVNTELKNETASLAVQFDNVMRNFYDNVEAYERKQNVNPYNYFRYYNPVYLTMKQTLSQLDTLRLQTIGAMQKIKNTHEKLRANLQADTKEEFIAEVKDLYYAMENIKRGYDNLKTLRSVK